ncbi:MAG: nucleotide pyrophosphatase, partial [Candidatus Parvarchaeota archaeon]
RYNLKIFGRERTFELLGGGRPSEGIDYPDLSAVPMDTKAYDYTYDFTGKEREKHMASSHGGLSADEMMVPLIRM